MADMSMDIREMTFQNVLETILSPAGVKVGGFPHELFLDLAEDEKDKWSCGICFLVANDCRQCDNRHMFCHTCVFAWSMTYGENSQKCPMCRCDQGEYLVDKEANQLIENKRVRCLEDSCSFKAPLKIFLMHSHGKSKYSNVHVDFDKLKMARPSGRRILLLPGLLPVGADRESRLERRLGIRSQLQQGRVMIHQMMMLLHMEMQLRQQALISYQEANDPVLRLQRLDEVLALNEQLNEVGGILSALLNTPLNGLTSAATRTPTPEPNSPFTPRTTPGNGGSRSPTRIMRARGLMNSVTSGFDGDDNDSDDSDDGSITDIVTSARRHYMPSRTLTPSVSSNVNQLRENNARRPQVDAVRSGLPSSRRESGQDASLTRRQSEARQEAPVSSSVRERSLLARQSEQPSTRPPASSTMVTTSVQRLGPRSCVTEVVAREDTTSQVQTPREEIVLPNIQSATTSPPGNSSAASGVATRSRGSTESAAVRAALGSARSDSTGNPDLLQRPNSVARQRAVFRLSTPTEQAANSGAGTPSDSTRQPAAASETSETPQQGDGPSQSTDTTGSSSSVTSSRAARRRSLQNSRLPPRVNQSSGSRTPGTRQPAGREITINSINQNRMTSSRGNSSAGASNVGNSNSDTTSQARPTNNGTDSIPNVTRQRTTLVTPNARTGPSALPRTPGQLIRARRRSEIHRHLLYRDRSDEA